jgi:hypothetical protein
MLDALEDENRLLLWGALHRKDLEAVQNVINDGVDVNIPDRVFFLYRNLINATTKILSVTSH